MFIKIIAIEFCLLWFMYEYSRLFAWFDVLFIYERDKLKVTSYWSVESVINDLINLVVSLSQKLRRHYM
jgi:hypothetical protein